MPRPFFIVFLKVLAYTQHAHTLILRFKILTPLPAVRLSTKFFRCGEVIHKCGEVIHKMTFFATNTHYG